MVVEPSEDSASTINRLVREHQGLSDEALLSALRSLEPLPPDRATAWQSDTAPAWAEAHLLIALAELAAERHLVSAVPLILERMCLGDPGELMRGLRHSLEDAVDRNWALLVQQCEEMCRSANPGARFWAADELGVLREPRSIPVLVELLDDPVSEIAEAASFALNLTARDHPAVSRAVLDALSAGSHRHPSRRAAFERDLTEVHEY